MKMLQAAPLIQAVIIFAACSTAATIAHYSEAWDMAYVVGMVFSAFGAAVTYLALGGEIS